MKFFKNLILGLFFVVTLSAQAAVTLPQIVCDLKLIPQDDFHGTLPQAPAPTVLSNTVLLPVSLGGEELPGSTPSEYYYDIVIYGVPIRGYRYPGPITLMIPSCRLNSINRFMLASDGNPRGVEILVQGEPSMDGLQLVVYVYGNVSLAWGPKPVWTLSMEYTYISPIPPEPMGTWGSPVDEGIQWIGLWNIFDGGHISKSPQPVGSDCNVGDPTPNEWIYESAPYQDENGNVIPERGSALKIPKAVCAEHGFGNYAFCYRAHQLKQTCNK